MMAKGKRARAVGILSMRARLMLSFIIEYKKAHDGNSPTLRETGQAAGVESSSLISFYLAELERAGYIKRNRLNARQIELVGGCYTYYEPEGDLQDGLSNPFGKTV